MKKLFHTVLSLLFLMVLIGSCQNDQSKLPANLIKNPKTAGKEKGSEMGSISFAKTEHDFGRLIQGDS